jgi:hypothetical protein
MTAIRNDPETVARLANGEAAWINAAVMHLQFQPSLVMTHLDSQRKKL